MIDPSSSEEEGEDDPVTNVPVKGRIIQTPKSVNSVSTLGVSSAAGCSLIATGSNSDLTANHKQSNPNTAIGRTDTGTTTVGQNSSRNSQIHGGRVDGSNLEIPTKTIPR